MDLTVRDTLKPLPVPPVASADQLARLVAARRERFGSVLTSYGPDPDVVYRYPVMAALVPVATARGGEVAYPGDPMCLYAALSGNIRRSVERRRTGLPYRAHLDDVYPDWGDYPDVRYRHTASGPRTELIVDNPTTDGKVFDPRIWDQQSRDRYVTELRTLRPRVVLLSAVSAAHRYALEMAELAKAHVPGCLVVLGGRHADETMRAQRVFGGLELSWCSTIEVIRDGRSRQVVDFVVAGDGAPLLDLLMQAVSLVYEPGFGGVEAEAVLDAVRLVAEQRADLSGIGTIAGLCGGRVVVQPIEGRAVTRAELPSPYDAFSIRARFEVFGEEARGSRTAHLMTVDACPFSCSFCSESVAVKGRLTRFATTETRQAADRMRQLAGWGAEAVFFDDPVFWGGNWTAIANFCRDLLALDGGSGGGVEWGAQLTVDVVLNRARARDIDTALDLMRAAGCSYVYVGIESMAEPVMRRINKNLLRRNPEPWAGKVREALDTIRSHGIRVGSSVLFGLDGENRETIAETVEKIGRLIDDELLIMASPNILTYHPDTEVSRTHGQEKLDYHSRKENRPPYTYFEEAYPEVVSKLLTEDDIWYIHEATAARWGTVRNSAAELDRVTYPHTRVND